MVPANVVSWSDHTTTLPPLPLAVASARIAAVVVDGDGVGPLQGPLAVASTADIDRAAAGLAGDVDGGALQRDVLARDRDGAACGLAPGGAQPSRDIDVTARAAADEYRPGLSADAYAPRRGPRCSPRCARLRPRLPR